MFLRFIGGVRSGAAQAIGIDSAGSREVCGLPVGQPMRLGADRCAPGRSASSDPLQHLLIDLADRRRAKDFLDREVGCVESPDVFAALEVQP